jgi:phage tail-like protein
MPTDPYKGYNFRVELDGITRAGFTDCSGLDSTQTPIPYREGTDALTGRKIPGVNTYSNIVLKWGLSDDRDLFDWRQKAVDGTVQRKNGSIVLLDDKGNEKIRWNFVNAWPTKWTGPIFSAAGTAIAVEQLDIAHEGVTRA